MEFPTRKAPSQNAASSVEFAWSVRVATLGVSPSSFSSFRPCPATLGDDWDRWLVEIFSPILGPAIRETHLLGQKLHLREIAAIDHKLGLDLDPNCSHHLIRASRPFIEGKEQMRGHREWSRYVRKLETGEAPGHLPVIFALHSLLFRLPLTTTLLAYAWLEWRTGHRAAGLSRHSGCPDFPPDLFLLVLDWIAPVITARGENENALSLRLL